MTRARQRQGRMRAFGAVALTCALLLAGPGLAVSNHPPQSLEYAVKANYLVRFAAFVSWPSSAFGPPSAPMDICIVGDTPFDGAVARSAANQTANARPLRVRHMERIDAASGCHIAYLGRSSSQSTGEALRALGEAPVLTVTDGRRGGDRGMIHFVVSDNRVRFHVDEAGASRAGLSVSSRLLSLALSVRRRS